MRQVGVLAAPCMIALTEQTKHLAKDHEMAILLASKLQTLPFLHLIEENIMINMIHLRIDNSEINSNDLV